MADNARQSGKVFVGGLSWDTTGEKLRAYFENWGVVREAFVSYNRANGRPRGFGFVVFQDAEVADKVVATKHTIDRREVEAKKAVPKEEQPDQGAGSAAGGSSAGVNDGSAAAGLAAKSRKIFVGGLAPAVDEAALRAHFEAFGPVEDAVVMYDHDNKRPRGFGFVTFAAEESVDLVFAKGAMQTIADKQIEVKSAVPRDLMPPTARPGQGYPGFDPRFAHGAGPRGLYGNPYLAAQGLHNQFAGLPLGGPPGRGYGGGPHRGIVPSAAGPQQHNARAPGRYDPTAAGLGQMSGFPQQQSAAMAHGMHSQGLGAAGGKVPPMGMQAGGGYGLYGAGASLSNGAGATGAMFGPGSSAALAYNIASLQQAQAHLNGMAAAGVPPAVQQGAGHAQVPAGGQGKLGGAAFGASAAASSLTSLKALAMASGLGGAFPGQAGPAGASGSGPGGDDGSGAGGFAVQQQQQPSEKDFADAAAAVNAAAAGLVQVATDYSSYHDPSSFSTAPAPGWSS